MKVRHLHFEQWLPRPRADVFPFFGAPEHLDDLTPPWLHFRILTPPPLELRPGLLIDYRLRLYGLPISWRTEITVVEPPYRFVDVQRRGPYRHWVHEHRFEEEAGGTRVIDDVAYAVPGWVLEPLIHRCLVAPDLHTIFAFRRGKLAELFGVA